MAAKINLDGGFDPLAIPTIEDDDDVPVIGEDDGDDGSEMLKAVNGRTEPQNGEAIGKKDNQVGKYPCTASCREEKCDRRLMQPFRLNSRLAKMKGREQKRPRSSRKLRKETQKANLHNNLPNPKPTNRLKRRRKLRMNQSSILNFLSRLMVDWAWWVHLIHGISPLSKLP